MHDIPGSDRRFGDDAILVHFGFSLAREKIVVCFLRFVGCAIHESAL